MKQLRSETTKYEEEKGGGRHCSVVLLIKTALESCGMWSKQVKVGSLKEIATDGSDSVKVEPLQVKVGSLKEVATDGRVKVEPLQEIAAEGDQLARETSEDQSSPGESTLLEKIEGAHENKINLRRVYETKEGTRVAHDHVVKLQHLWNELQELRTLIDGKATPKQGMVSRVLASIESSYGWLVEMVLKGEQLPEMEEMCALVERAHKRMRDENRLTMSRSESSWKPTGSRSESFQKLTMSRSEGSWRLTGSRSESFRKKRRGRMVAKGFSNMIRRRKRVVGKCNYSAYMGESIEDSGIMRKLRSKGEDERVTKEEWNEFAKYVYALATTRSLGAPAKASTSNKRILIDSGASHHMISDKSLLSDIKRSNNGSVEIANGTKIPIEGVGKLQLFGKDSDAFYMPQFASNLLSVRRATVDLSCQVVFKPNDVEFQDLKTGKVIGRGDSMNNLYQLQLDKISKPFDAWCLSSTTE